MVISTLLWLSLATGSLAIHLEMISLLPRSIPVGPALPFTEPALRLAVEMVNRTYAPNITISLKLIYNMAHKSCDDADADNPGMLGQYYYHRKLENPSDICLAVVGSICGGLNEAANLGREWNILVISDGLVIRDAFNNQRQPTAMSLGGAIDSYAMVLMKILDQHRWTHVSIFADTATGPGFYGLLNTAMMKMSTTTSGMYSFESTNFNGRDVNTVLPLLLHAKTRSRVIFLLTLTARAQKILEIARIQNMTNWEYVYFIVQPLEQDQYGKVTLLSNASDEVASAYGTVVYVTAHRSGDSVMALNRQLAARTGLGPNGKPIYDNNTQPLDNFSVRATYDSVELFAKVINETYNQQSPDSYSCDGKMLAQMMSNRSFTLQTGESFVTSDGTRNLDLDIYGYSLAARAMEPLMWYDSVRNALVKYPEFAKDTERVLRSPLVRPPPNQPRCGYSGQSGPCAPETLSMLATVLPITGAAVLLAVIIIWIGRRFKKATGRNDRWWLVMPEDLHIQTVTKESCKTEMKDKTVWIKPVSIAPNFNTDSLLGFTVLKQLREIHHPNVNTFLGICCYSPNDVAYLISEHCPRGNLVELQSRTVLDWDLTFSLLCNLVKGLLYIHRSSIHYHGTLDVYKCLIDARFALKIGALRYDAITALLKRNLKTNTPERLPLSATISSKNRPLVETGQKNDIWAFGKIATSLLGQVPSDPEQSTSKYMHLEAFLVECASDTTKQRPTIQMVVKAINTYSQSNIHDVVGLVMLRVQKYTEILENAVAEKTKELINEQLKADKLLREMLPPSVVDKLRNKIVIEPEYFEVVTISFSDLPGFVTWVATATPFEAIALLNTIYSVFDQEISSHHLVQKIETIADCYMVASGVPIRIGNEHAAAVCRLAKAMHSAFSGSKLADKGLMLRVGVHSDHCAASVIGSKVPRYCLFGDAVNTASRMESHGEGGKVHLSYKTRAFLHGCEDLVCERRGLVNIKGKGEMETFWLVF